jgi:nucleotide-binding universal stress UspA family protein
MEQPSHAAGLPQETVNLLSMARTPFARVFVPVDYSGDSHRAVGVALELHRIYGSAVCLFHVHHDEGGDEFLGGIGAVQQQRGPDALGRLRRFVDNIAPGTATRVEMRARVGGEGEKAEFVLEAAAEWDATLIVVTSAQHRTLFPSLAQRVVKKANVAVLALPASPPDQD